MMATVTLRLFGFGSRASGYETKTRVITEGASVRELWEDMRSSANPESLLAHIEEKKVWVLINGGHFNQLKKWETPLEDGDTVTFMVFAMGG